MHQIFSINLDRYQRHRIHTQERDWAETNCYVDIWIEQLHALGFEPVAAMAFTLAIDFEGDQWTFFKFPLSNLYTLYGLDVQELAVWKPLTKHIEEQIEQGRPVLVELDSYHLPDTAGMAYKLAHVKSTVAVNLIDLENQRLGYFHGQGYYELEGADFDSLFYLNSVDDPGRLPPYVEIIKRRQRSDLSLTEIHKESIKQLRQQLTMLPEINPFIAFQSRFEVDLIWLKEQDLGVFHQYSFATFRQFGACYELAANYLEWLVNQGESDLENVIKAIRSISENAKTYQFQLARAIARGKELDLSPISQMKDSWDIAMSDLRQKYL